MKITVTTKKKGEDHSTPNELVLSHGFTHTVAKAGHVFVGQIAVLTKALEEILEDETIESALITIDRR